MQTEVHMEPSLQIGSLKHSSAEPATAMHTHRCDLVLISILEKENILQHSLHSVLMSNTVTSDIMAEGLSPFLEVRSPHE